MSFLMPTPKMDDQEIRDRVKKSVFVRDCGANKKEAELMENKRKNRKQLEKLITFIEKTRASNKEDIHNLIHDQIIENIKGDEFLRTLNMIKETDFADYKLVKTLFMYK